MHTRSGIALLFEGVLLCMVVLLMISCGGQGRGKSGEPMREAPPDSLAARIVLDEGSYAIGEPIVMTLEVVNRTDRGITLTFPTAQRYDFVVRHGKAIVWQWSDGRMFAQVLGRYELAPRDTIAYEYRWDQTLMDGTKPGLGAYTIEGMLMISPPLETGAKTFGIVD
jgi:hypothetical protein